MSLYIQKFQDYLQLEKKYSIHTVSAYVKDVKDFSFFLNSELDFQDLIIVEYKHIRQWIISLVDEKLSNITINRKIASLKSFYNFLVKIDHLEFSPLAKHRALKVQKKIQIPFSEEEIQGVLDHSFFADDFEGFRNRLILELFYSTGIRKSELMSMTLADFDSDNFQIKVLGKRNKERIVPIVKNTVKIYSIYIQKRFDLETIVDKDVLFLTKKGFKINNSLVYRLVNDYFSEVSIKQKKSPHMLRHTFATHMLNNGADLNSVKELLGHSSLASTQVYVNISLNQIQNVFNNAFKRGEE